MKTEYKCLISAVGHLLGRAVWAGMFLLIAPGVQAQNLFVSDQQPSVYEFTPGGTQSTFTSGLYYSAGLAFNSVGVLFVGDDGYGKIYEFTTNGVQSTFASGLDAPAGLAFNSAGVLFVANVRSGTIIEIATNGVQSPFAAGLNIPEFLAFQPVFGPPPPLNIATTGNQSVLFWSASGNNYILQSTTNLASANWVTATDAVPVTAFTVTNGSPARYFRLAQP
jgi:hypothetical protein